MWDQKMAFSMARDRNSLATEEVGEPMFHNIRG
jgi:hypothetical protein